MTYNKIRLNSWMMIYYQEQLSNKKIIIILKANYKKRSKLNN